MSNFKPTDNHIWELSGETKVEFGITFHRIKFRDTSALGGWVENPEKISPTARVSGDAHVYGNAYVYGNAHVSGNAHVYGNAHVSGNARVYGNAYVSGNARVVTGYINANKTIIDNLRAQCFVTPSPDGTMVMYKRVNTKENGVYASCYDPRFLYRDGDVAIVEHPDESDESCAPGIHVSHPLYWDEGDTLIAVRVHIDDVITVQQGKARCRKVTVIGKV